MFGRATDSYDLDGTTTAEEKIVTPFTSDEIISGMKKLTERLIKFLQYILLSVLMVKDFMNMLEKIFR